MTFYWWSHWFWITLLGNFMLLSTFVHTYPNKEIILEYNASNNEVAKTVTRLFKTGTTINWGTIDSTTAAQIMELTQSDLSIERAEPMENADIEDIEIEDEIDEREQRQHKNDKNSLENDDREFEVKRSAEMKEIIKHENLELSRNISQENAMKINRKPTITMTEDDSLGVKTRNENDMTIVNKHDSFSVNISNLSTNKTKENNFTNTTIDPHINQYPPSAPSAPLINTKPSAAEWFKKIVAQLPPAVSQHSIDDIASNMVTTSSASRKIPFTLENVNREDELRRAENEHRTRKSKVLSAEYKQINRFINFSSDPKNLLIRSASASPNDFDNGDGDGNISSEALSIQRTYFLDAGEISAICFSVFGVCCTIGTIGIVFYRRRFLNKPQTLSEPDSSVYIDDSTMRVSDNSDEMYSLDNDSFLNSLEAMTIQNYWTDTVKHTKL